MLFMDMIDCALLICKRKNLFLEFVLCQITVATLRPLVLLWHIPSPKITNFRKKNVLSSSNSFSPSLCCGDSRYIWTFGHLDILSGTDSMLISNRPLAELYSYVPPTKKYCGKITKQNIFVVNWYNKYKNFKLLPR